MSSDQVPKQENNVKPQYKPREGYGFHQHINFGPHKGKTVYDVANEGEYEYLRQLLRPPRAKSTFKLSIEFSNHVKAALLTAGIPNAHWRKEQSLMDEFGVCIMWYETDNINGSCFHSPEIKMIPCCVCKQYKNNDMFEQGSYICSKCKNGISSFPVYNPFKENYTEFTENIYL